METVITTTGCLYLHALNAFLSLHIVLKVHIILQYKRTIFLGQGSNSALIFKRSRVFTAYIHAQWHRTNSFCVNCASDRQDRPKNLLFR